MDITRHADATAILSDTRYIPAPVPQDAPHGTLAWLRARVSRFSTGQTHANRRARVTAELAAIDPDALREAARAATTASWEHVPTAVLGAALGVTDTHALVEAVDEASQGYLTGESGPRRDAAVAVLLDLLDTGDEETTVARASLLLQSHAATSTLIAHALRHDGELHETLRHDPPLAATRRIDRESGEPVTIDLVRANRDPDVFPDPDTFDPARGETPHLTFGYGVRPCPGSAHALALAAGVLEGLNR